MFKKILNSFFKNKKQKKISKHTGSPSNVYKDFNFVFHKEEMQEHNGVKRVIHIYKKYGYNSQTKENDFIGLIEK